MTDEEIRKKVDRDTKKFIKSVKAFLAVKAGGVIPEEWTASIMLLEAYYRQFLELDLQIQQLPSLVIQGRYGLAPSPLLNCRDKASVRLEAQLKEMGLTMAKALKMNVVDVRKASTPLDEFLKKKVKEKE